MIQTLVQSCFFMHAEILLVCLQNGCIRTKSVVVFDKEIRPGQNNI